MDETSITEASADAIEIGTKQPLTGQSVTACAIDSEQLPAMFRRSLEIKRGFHIRVGMKRAQEPEQQH